MSNQAISKGPGQSDIASAVSALDDLAGDLRVALESLEEHLSPVLRRRNDSTGATPDRARVEEATSELTLRLRSIAEVLQIVRSTVSEIRTRSTL